MTTIHTFSKRTGEYMGSAEARKAADGMDLIPAHATTVAPPDTGDYQSAIWNGTEWVVKTDYRGVSYWFDPYNEQRIEPTADQIGVELPQGAMLTKPEETQEYIDQRRAGEIRSRLNVIDNESVRAMRAATTGRDTQADRDRLNALEDEAETLRAELDTITQ